VRGQEPAGAQGRPRPSLGPWTHVASVRQRLPCWSARTQGVARPTMDLNGESGQSTIEWLALMATIVALAGVLITTMPGVGHTIVDTVGKLIRSVIP
jgi:hypothetical protein